MVSSYNDRMVGDGHDTGPHVVAQWSARPFWIFVGVLLAAALVAISGLGVVDRLSRLHTLADGPSPYFVSGHAILLYFWVPLVSLAACFIVLLPGMVTATVVTRRDFVFTTWLLKSFAISLAGLGVLVPVFERIAGLGPLTGAGFLAFALAISLPGLVGVWLADRRGEIDWSEFRRRRTDIAAMIVVPVIMLLVLSPKFYWENFNGDGAHALQSARLFIHTGLPFWPENSGVVGSYPSITTLLEVFANSWFVRLFGEHEYSLRMSALLGLSLLTGVLMGFARKTNESPSSAAVAIGIGASLLLYAFVLAFQASYDPYFADIALPMTREPQVMVAFLGFVTFFLRRQYFWMTVFSGLTFIAVPSGIVLTGFVLIATALVWSPVPWRHLVKSGVLILAVAVVAKAIPIVLANLGLIGAHDEFSSGNLLRRLRFVTPFVTERLAYWIVPGGIVPALALLAWRWQDRVARIFTLVTLAYAAFFYFQAYRILPHHFAPAMIMPLVVFWRLRPSWAYPVRAATVILVGVTIGVVLVRPAQMGVNSQGRDLGARILIENSHYHDFDPQELDIAHELLRQAFPMNYEEGAAARQYIGSPLAWYTYAAEAKAPGQQIDFVIRKLGAPVRADERLLSSYRGYGLYGRGGADAARLSKQAKLARSIGDLFYVPRSVVFGQGARQGDWPVWDLAHMVGLR